MAEQGIKHDEQVCDLFDHFISVFLLPFPGIFRGACVPDPARTLQDGLPAWLLAPSWLVDSLVG
jgi:hypothetical protein